MTERLDAASGVSVFSDRNVVILGCGAIGSRLAEHLVRFGVTPLTLVDDKEVSSGSLLTQAYDAADVTVNKAVALARRLKRINPHAGVAADQRDARSILRSESSPLWDTDIIFDATGGTAVAKQLESVRSGIDDRTRPWVVSMLLGRSGDRGLVTVAAPCTIGGSLGLVRHAKLAACTISRLAAFADDFWPQELSAEPGCSEPAFVGFDVDVAAVVAALTREAATVLNNGTEGSWMMTELAGATAGGTARSEHSEVSNQIEMRDAGLGYSVHVPPHVMVELSAHINHSTRNTPASGTGGVLFGEIDEATRTVAVTAALGPPPDSEASADGFVCGVDGVAAAAEALLKDSRGTHRMIGWWHTHLGGDPASPADHGAMRALTAPDADELTQQLLLVAGGNPLGSEWNCYLYDANQPDSTQPEHMPCHVPIRGSNVGRIGLAMSGGGLRAAAFHLGCLRALNDRELLDKASTISGVSGGSLVAALWAYTSGSFEEFDDALVSLLQDGLWKPTVAKWFAPRRIGKALVTTATAGLSSVSNMVMDNRSTSPRSTSSVHALEAAIRGRITDAQISDVAREGVNVVINACDLRTGSAFRFGNVESGTWREGFLKDNHVSVATAVAASTAHPAAFPAYDFVGLFVRRDGTEHERRVILADGGIYDNLGTSALLSNRLSTISSHAYLDHDWIIACDAGRGLFEGRSQPYWYISRLKRSFDCTYRKAQDSDRARLFELNERSGTLKGFVVATLGMDDAKLPIPDPALVPREEVIGFKTNLSALTDEQIDLLSRRGEQIMGALVARHGPRF